MSRPQRLGGVMAAALAELDLDLRWRESQALAAWAGLVGETTAAQTRAMHVNRGVLHVAVRSSAWANQLNLLKGRLLDKLEERCGPGVIRDIRWRVGEGAAHEAMMAGEDPRRRAVPMGDAVRLKPAEEAVISSHVGGIGDARLGTAYGRLLAAAARQRVHRERAGWQPCPRCGVLADPVASPAGVCGPCQRSA